jgi:Tol biopolymer transport system component
VEGKVGQEQRQLRKPAFSPDGKRIAVMGLEGDLWDIWVHDIATATRTRLTFKTGMDWDPIWSPDGSTIYFWDGEARVIAKVPADGNGAVERVVPEDTVDSGDPSITRDGRMLIFWVKIATSASDLWYLPLQGERKSTPLMTTTAQETNPRFSPDGRYVAYESDESGSKEIYLTRFPGGDGKWQVSTQGGSEPVWSPSGDRLYFRSGDAVMEATISTQPTVRSGVPRRLFLGRDIGVKVDQTTRFAISPDGRRFVMVQPILTQGAGPRLVLVEHWRPESGPAR